jgi:uncharacterized protein
MQLSPIAVRLLGCLAEKELTVPDTYPMTVNALLVAANQVTNRFPICELSTQDVIAGLGELKGEHRLARMIPSGAGSRVDKYRHVLEDRLGLSRPEKAVLTVLTLRGPQTVAEIRARTNRMHDFPDQAAVERVLERLSDPTQAQDPTEPSDARQTGMLTTASTAGAVTSLREGYARTWSGPLIVRLDRQPGQNEPRVMHLLGGEVDAGSLAVESGSPTRVVSTGAAAANSAAAELTERVEHLEATVARLEAELQALRTDLGA